MIFNGGMKMKIFIIIFILIISSLNYGMTIEETFMKRAISVKKDKYYKIEKLCDLISDKFGINIELLKSTNKHITLKFPEEKISLSNFFKTLLDEGAIIQLLYKNKINFIIYLPPYELTLEANITESKENNLFSSDIFKSFKEIVKIERPGGYELREIAEILADYHNISIIDGSFETEFCIEKGISFLEFLEKISKFEKSVKLLLYIRENKIIFQIEVFRPKWKNNFFTNRISVLDGCLGEMLVFAKLKDEALSFIFPVLENSYKKKIILVEESIKDIKISYSKNNVPIDEFLKDICDIAGVYFHFEKDKIKIERKKNY